MKPCQLFKYFAAVVYKRQPISNLLVKVVLRIHNTICSITYQRNVDEVNYSYGLKRMLFYTFSMLEQNL